MAPISLSIWRMEFLSFDSIVGFIAAFGSFCLGVSLLGHIRREKTQLILALFFFTLSTAFFLCSIKWATEKPWTLSVPYSLAVIIVTYIVARIYFAKSAFSILSETANLILLLILSAITTRLLVISGSVLGPFYMMVALLFATTLTFSSLSLQIQSGLLRPNSNKIFHAAILSFKSYRRSFFTELFGNEGFKAFVIKFIRRGDRVKFHLNGGTKFPRKLTSLSSTKETSP